MQPTITSLKDQTWRRDGHVISTDISLIPRDELHSAFASPEMYWANPLPDDVLKMTLENSLCFAVYETPAEGEGESGFGPAPGKFIGFARCITDYTTFLYLTDVWVDRACQGKGIGKWLIQSVQEVIEKIPHLRRSLLFTGDWTRSVPFYEKLMGMTVMETKPGQGLAVMERKGPAHPNYHAARPDYP